MNLTREYAERAIRAAAQVCIAAYGNTPEHSYDCYRYYTDSDQNRVFLQSEEGYGIMAYENDAKNAWEFLGEPLAPRERHAPLVREAIREIFSDPTVASVQLDIRTETREALLGDLPPGLKAEPVEETLLWPLCDMSGFDPAWPGPRFKALRNVRSRFAREHTFETVDAAQCATAGLRDVVKKWAARRPAAHEASLREYQLLIDDIEARTMRAHALTVDGAPEALFGGWRIPNSDGFYLFLALHSYAYWGLGEMLMMRALEEIQKEGYRFADLGGSDQPLYDFKKRFGAAVAYETHRFQVVRSA